jgi:hypothetical protein
MVRRARTSRSQDPLIQQHLAKYDKLFPALALILHLAESASTTCMEMSARRPQSEQRRGVSISKPMLAAVMGCWPTGAAGDAGSGRKAKDGLSDRWLHAARCPPEAMAQSDHR